MKRPALLWVVAACAAPRLLALCLWPAPAHTYLWDLSESLLRGGGFGFDGRPTTYIEPLYPGTLAAMRFIARDTTPVVLLLQILLACLGGVLLFHLAERTAERRAAWIAVLFYAAYPYLVRQSVAYLDLNLIIPLMLATALLLVRATNARTAAACGAVFGLLLLGRASFGLTLLAACGWLAWQRRPALAAIVLASAVAVQAPWLVRNLRIDGSLLPTRIGENLLVSTSWYAETVVPAYDIDTLMPLAYADASAALPPREQESRRQLDRAMRDRAMQFVREHPWRAVRLKLRNALSLLDPRLLPRYPAGPDARAVVENGRLRFEGLRTRPRVEEISHAVACASILLLAAFAFWRRRLTMDDEGILLVAATNALVCVVFFPSTRLLAPTSTLLMVYAGVGASRLARTRAWRR